MFFRIWFLGACKFLVLVFIALPFVMFWGIYVDPAPWVGVLAAICWITLFALGIVAAIVQKWLERKSATIRCPVCNERGKFQNFNNYYPGVNCPNCGLVWAKGLWSFQICRWSPSSRDSGQTRAARR